MMHMINKKGVSLQFKFYFIQVELPATIQKWILLVVMQNIFLYLYPFGWQNRHSP